MPIDLSVELWGDNFHFLEVADSGCVCTSAFWHLTRTHTYNLTDTHTHIELYILINHGYRLQRDQTQRFFHPSAAIERKKKKKNTRRFAKIQKSNATRCRGRAAAAGFYILWFGCTSRAVLGFEKVHSNVDSIHRKFVWFIWFCFVLVKRIEECFVNDRRVFLLCPATGVSY